MPIFFDYFESNSVEPELLVNREEALDELLTRYCRYLDLCGDPKRREPAPLVYCMTGDKGVGKSILARALLNELRSRHSGDTLFLEVDCRRNQSSRAVLGRVAKAIQSELRSFTDTGKKLPDGLEANANLLVELTHFTSADIETKKVYEFISRFKAAVNLGGDKRLLSSLALYFGISFEKEKRETEALSGRINFDEERLTQLLVDFFQDLRDADFKIVLLLDNFDELDHNYGTEDCLERVKKDTSQILKLREAPIAALFCMRTYYDGVIPRDIKNRLPLAPLDAENMQKILDRRLLNEEKAIRDELEKEEAQAGIRCLADRAPTPLTFLAWFQFAASKDMLSPAELNKAAKHYVSTHYGSVGCSTLNKLCQKIREKGDGKTPDITLSRNEVLEAIAGDEAVLTQLQDRQVILPRDFWHPLEFSLDPDLHWYYHSLP